MLLVIEDVLSKEEVAEFRAKLAAADWIDGAASAGSRSVAVKQNLQLDQQSALAIDLENRILHKLGGHPLFVSAALPEKIYPPMFNRYQNGGHYGTHVDSAIMRVEEAGVTIRTDLSATLFLSEPEEYEGGELVIEGRFGAQAAKLPAGDMILYPSCSLHQVTPVTQGQRIASFFWMQSAVQDDGARDLLFDLDQSIQSLSADRPKDDPDIERLVCVYHNLLRRSSIV